LINTDSFLDLHHTHEVVRTSQQMTCVYDFQENIEYLETSIFGLTGIKAIVELANQSVHSDHS